MGFHFKISLYGVTKCVTRMKRICTLTWYSSDNDWRMTAIIINKVNQKIYGKEPVTKVIEDVLVNQMKYTVQHYDSLTQETEKDSGGESLTDLVCMFTCSAQHWHPPTYEFADYTEDVHNRQMVYTIRPSAEEACGREVNRIRDKVLDLIQIFMKQPRLVKEPDTPWRLDLYFYEPQFKNTERELIRLVGLVSDPSEYSHMKGLKVYVGHKDDYMVCRTPEALIFVIEQRLNSFLEVVDSSTACPKELPSTFYGYTNQDITDLLGKYTRFTTYDEQQIKTHCMFVMNYRLRDWNQCHSKSLATVLYRGLTSRVLHIYSGSTV